MRVMKTEIALEPYYSSIPRQIRVRLVIPNTLNHAYIVLKDPAQFGLFPAWMAHLVEGGPLPTDEVITRNHDLQLYLKTWWPEIQKGQIEATRKRRAARRPRVDISVFRIGDTVTLGLDWMDTNRVYEVIGAKLGLDIVQLKAQDPDGAEADKFVDVHVDHLRNHSRCGTGPWLWQLPPEVTVKPYFMGGRRKELKMDLHSWVHWKCQANPGRKVGASQLVDLDALLSRIWGSMPKGTATKKHIERLFKHYLPRCLVGKSSAERIRDGMDHIDQMQDYWHDQAFAFDEYSSDEATPQFAKGYASDEATPQFAKGYESEAADIEEEEIEEYIESEEKCKDIELDSWLEPEDIQPTQE